MLIYMPMTKGKFRKTGRKTSKKQVANYGRPPTRALGAPNIYQFKRTISQDVALTPADSFWTSQGNNLGRAFAFSLSGLDDPTDFQDLFKYYRLKGARIRMYFSNTNSSVTRDGQSANYFPNSQILVSIDRNLNGETQDVANEQHYLSSQTCKRQLALRSDGQPVDIYMPLKQGNLVYQNATTTNNTMQTPKFLSTDNPDTPHWGYNLMLQRVDAQGFTSAFADAQAVKILTTLYFECKKVE